MLTVMSASARITASDPVAAAGVGTLARLFSLHDQWPPYALVDVLAASLADIGVTRTVLHLASHDGERLVGLLPKKRSRDSILKVDGSLPGRVYVDQQQTEIDDGSVVRILVPVTERSYRLGVLELEIAEADDEVRRVAAEYALLAAQLLITDGRYTDFYTSSRRLEPMQLPAELQWQMLPPRAMRFGAVSVAGMLVPAYDVGGDLFDYSGEPDTVHVAVFDCMGHGLISATISGLVAAAYRNARRSGFDLNARADAVDSALRQFSLDVFATGIIGEVDMRSGQLRYVNHAHPDPLLLRDGSIQRLSPADRAVPMGLADGRASTDEAEVQRIDLRGGDVVVFYTDGAIEIRDPHGRALDDEGFADLLQRHAKLCDDPWEMTRRVAGELMEYRMGDLVDDATVMILRYAPEA